MEKRSNQDSPGFGDDVIATLADSGPVEFPPQTPPTLNLRAPEYWERNLEPKWHDPNRSPASVLSVHGAMFQELAWIRRILIHGENLRSQIICNEMEHKEAQDLYAQNQAKLIKNVGTYSMMRLGFGVVQTAILGGILVAVLMS